VKGGGGKAVAKRRTKRKPARSAPARTGDKPVKSQRTRVRSANAPLLTAAMVLAALGALLTAYLTAVRWLGQSPAYCDAGSGCDLVQASRWSMLLGMPVSFWGFLTYLLLAVLLWHLRGKRVAWARALTVAAFGTGMSLYLTAVSLLEIEATCVYCLTSLGIISTITVMLVFLRPRNLQRFDWGTWCIGTGGGISVILVALHLHYSGVFDPAVGPEKPYLRKLAEHLHNADARFYGAYWCPHCQDQKTLFEASAHRLPYVECTPSGRGGPVAVECVTNGIESYPTWIIAGRRHEGILSAESLARRTGFRRP